MRFVIYAKFVPIVLTVFTGIPMEGLIVLKKCFCFESLGYVLKENNKPVCFYKVMPIYKCNSVLKGKGKVSPLQASLWPRGWVEV